MDYNYVTRDPAAPATHCPVCHTGYSKEHPPYVPPEPVPPPQVPARRAASPEEIASGTGQAMSTGRLGRKHGWEVTAIYFREAYGAETCVLSLYHPDRGRFMSLHWSRPDRDAKWSYDSGLTWKNEPDTFVARGIAAMRRLIESEEHAPAPQDPAAAQDGDPRILPAAAT